MCMDPKSEAAAGIVDAVMRSIHPDAGRSRSDALARLRKRLRILHETLNVDSPDQPGVLPWTKKNFELGSRSGVLIGQADLETLVRKWVRGLHAYFLHLLIPADVP